MRYLLLALSLALYTPALAQETLPDSARVQEDDSAEMAARFQAPVMDQDEMQELYLEAPGVVDNTETRGLEGLNDNQRYTETDLRFRERFQNDPNASAPSAPVPLPPLRRPDAPTPPGSPLQQL